MSRFGDVSLKNKIFFSILAVILIISSAIAFLARWILVSSLISELELRGIAIARTVAERGGGYILDKSYPQLLSLIFDEAQLNERKHLVAYIFIADQENAVLSHTFIHPFPDELRLSNQVDPDKSKSVQLLTVDNRAVYDIAIPINEGIYRIGTVHVGLNKEHIDSLVGKLRITFLGFISMVIIIIFAISHALAKYITRPISELTRISDELSRGNFDIKLDIGSSNSSGWDPAHCPAYVDTDLPCWHFDDMVASLDGPQRVESNWRTCRHCVFYRKRGGDEVAQLADSFHNMVWSIKLYRRRLHESEEKYRSLFDSGPDPILVVDSTTLCIIDVNPRVLELYGYEKDELTGKPFMELEHEQEHERKGMATFAADGEARGCLFYQKVIHRKKDGKTFFVNLNACHISYKGRPAIIVAITDISEMMEKDAQLIQASKMKTLGEMSAGMAHELNQPLNAIKIGSDFLDMMIEANREIPKDQLQQVVTEISTQVDRAADIINALRAFGRRSDLITEKVHVNKPVRGVYSILGRQFDLENVSIRLDLKDDIPPVLAHDNRLQQIFFNLVTNARDAIMERRQSATQGYPGIIAIRTYEADGRIVAEVEDNGAGISDAVRDKIFEPFFTTKETSQDMGLGLAITYGIVKDYGGEIQIRSKESEGTTFVLSFPAAI
jgi:histidine kinase